MENNYVTMAREVEKLHLELTNTANVDRRAGILFLFVYLKLIMFLICSFYIEFIFVFSCWWDIWWCRWE